MRPLEKVRDSKPAFYYEQNVAYLEEDHEKQVAEDEEQEDELRHELEEDVRVRASDALVPQTQAQAEHHV
jgi:hypothetical protein